MNSKKLFWLLLLLPLCLWGTAWAIGPGSPGPETGLNLEGERILSFDSIITVHPNSSLTVSETIEVQATGQEIKHGIYRDFPVIYKDNTGNRYRIDFKIMEVTRDGKPEDYFTEPQMNRIRIYAGRKDYLLPPGIYRYRFTYQVDRELGFFKDHDELYWNVNGTGWTFPLDRISCTVQLPPGIPGSKVQTTAYTGLQGETGRDYQVTTISAGTYLFRSLRPLAANENLSVVIGWPKGFVQEPTREQRLIWLLRDNAGIFLGLIGLLLICCYYLIIWFFKGRDPRQGTIIPLYSPPANLSPAAMRYIMRMGYDQKCFTAALINLGVKGILKIENHAGDYTLHQTSADYTALPMEERQAAQELFAAGTSLKLKQSNHDHLSSAIEKVQSTLKQNYFKKYFVTNSIYLIPGVIITVISILASSWLQTSSGAGAMGIFPAAFMLFWLSGWTTGVFFLTKQVLAGWREYQAAKSPLTFAAAVPLTFFALPFWFGELIGIVVLAFLTSIWIVLMLFVMLGLTLLFHYLFKAPTIIGRQAIDRIEGFKQFLSMTEKDRIKILRPIEQNLSTFERFLPYAMALEVEDQWAQQFISATTPKAGQEPSWSPVWYAGTAFNLSGMDSAIGSSFAGAIAASATAPGSSSGFSSGGGGGGSGGGGGGGGGGGW